METGTAEKTGQATGKERVETPAPSTGLDKDKGGAETKTYLQSELDAALGRAGQKAQAKLELLTAERDTLKSQAGTLTTEVAEASEKIKSLTNDIDVMSVDDPDKQGLVKLRKEKEEELKVLKTEKATIAESRKEMEQWKHDRLIYTVADEFVKADGTKVDLDSFKTAAGKLNLSGREALETLAETLEFKLKSETGEPEVPPSALPPPAHYSGRTEGGGDNIGNLSPKERLAETTKRLKENPRG